jgi:hypothetical protein
LIEKLKRLVEDMDALLDEQKERDILPRIVIDNSVFVPLLLEKEGIKHFSTGIERGREKIFGGSEGLFKRKPKNFG